MAIRKTRFCAGETYHLYNRGNDRRRIFFERENYLFFLRRVRKYLLPQMEIAAYCLMPNHYHLLVRVREIKTSDFFKKSDVCQEVSEAMRKLSISYTKAINKRYHHVGSLFQGPFQAKHVDTPQYLLDLSCYLHLNPVKAGLITEPAAWEFSSYQEYSGVRVGTLPKPEIVLTHLPPGQNYQGYWHEYVFWLERL
ncbi:MAG: transposase [Anaerolineae bacterium]|nr:transposase [Anaerolineae bacterium]